ncbi:hypothetical protein C0J52_22756 [Blattella germanica]|nr:hypothetical protein C0J52_22756 [Blattella germanica]
MLSRRVGIEKDDLQCVYDSDESTRLTGRISSHSLSSCTGMAFLQYACGDGPSGERTWCMSCRMLDANTCALSTSCDHSSCVLFWVSVGSHLQQPLPKRQDVMAVVDQKVDQQDLEKMVVSLSLLMVVGDDSETLCCLLPFDAKTNWCLMVGLASILGFLDLLVVKFDHDYKRLDDELYTKKTKGERGPNSQFHCIYYWTR